MALRNCSKVGWKGWSAPHAASSCLLSHDHDDEEDDDDNGKYNDDDNAFYLMTMTINKMMIDDDNVDDENGKDNDNNNAFYLICIGYTLMMYKMVIINIMIDCGDVYEDDDDDDDGAGFTDGDIFLSWPSVKSVSYEYEIQLQKTG